MAYAAGHAWVAFSAAALAAGLGLITLTLSLRQHRAGPGMVSAGHLPIVAREVAVTGASVLLLAVASLDLVLL